MPAVEPADLVGAHRLDRAFGAGDRPAQRRRAVGLAGEQVVHDVVGVVVVHRDLVEDDVALGLDVLVGDRRAGDHVAQHVDGQRQVLVEDPRVEAGVLLGGEGVELAAHRVEGDGDVERRALRGALEEQVLEEVGAAVQSRRLVTRADVDPHPDAGRARAGHVLGDDPQPAGQEGTTHPRRHLAGTVADRLEGPGAPGRLGRRRSTAGGLGGRRPAERTHSESASGSGVATGRSASTDGSAAASPSSSTTGTSDSLPRSSISAICTWIF